jgi:prostaglandin-H2 D-isomerase / glutathione transferase
MGMSPAAFGHGADYAKTDEGKACIAKLRTRFAKDELPIYLERMSSMMEAHGGKWLVAGEEPTVADCLAVPALRAFTRGFIDHVDKDCLDAHPRVVEYLRNFCALDGVKGRYRDGIC